MTKPVGVGIVGAGVISTQYLRTLTGLPEIDVRFVADLDVARAKTSAAEFRVPTAGTVADLLAEREACLRTLYPAGLQRPNAQANMSGSSARQKAPPCDPSRSVITTSAPASRSASAHRVAFSRKKGSSVPATR